MTRYYRRRKYRKSNGLQDAAAIVVLILIAYTYTSSGDFFDKYPYAIPLFIGLVITLLVLIIGLWWYRRLRAKRIFEAYTIANIDAMDGLEFERYLANLLRRRGFTGVRLTERYDLGIDIIARKDGITWGVQAKRYGGLVKAAAIRQAYTALTRYKCDRAMVISNSTYSRPARLLAQDTNSVLIDREELSKWIYEASTGGQ
jgi:restriction system protein